MTNTTAYSEWIKNYPKLHKYLMHIIQNNSILKAHLSSVFNIMLNINVSLAESLEKGFSKFSDDEIAVLASTDEKIVRKLLELRCNNFIIALDKLIMTMLRA